MKGIVYGKSSNSARIQLNKIIKGYEKNDIKIEQKKCYGNDFYVVFNNNDSWLATKVNEHCRGRSCNVAYIDVDIPLDIVEQIVKPTIKASPFQAYNFY